ncbi:MAG: hypothetical protein ACKVQU_26325 [Burkholderiales bacterium]
MPLAHRKPRARHEVDPAMSDDAVTVEYLLETLVIAGTVNRVVDEILALRETTGPFGGCPMNSRGPYCT